MKRLTKIQIDHLSMRITEAIGKLIKRETEVLGPRPVLNALTFEQQVDFIRRGKATLKPNDCLNHYTDLNDAYTYPMTPERKRLKAAQKAWDTKAEVIAEKYRREQDRMIDEAVLGDSDTALHMLQILEAQLSK